MEKLSRVKKNQSFRDLIEEEQEEVLVSPGLTSYAQRLNRIDPHISSASSIPMEESYTPLHHRKQQELSAAAALKENEHAETDYIRTFLDEVRNYNIKKGYRDEEDTQSHILKRVHSDDIVRSRDHEDILPAASQTENDLTEEIKKVLMDDLSEIEEKRSEVVTESNSDTNTLSTVLEETQRLNIKLNDYEKELIDMNQSVITSHRILNIVVFVLVLVLFLLLGFALYWIFVSKGYN